MAHSGFLNIKATNKTSAKEQAGLPGQHWAQDASTWRGCNHLLILMLVAHVLQGKAPILEQGGSGHEPRLIHMQMIIEKAPNKRYL
jgi:hypothetical protein